MTSSNKNQEKKRPPLDFEYIKAQATGRWLDLIFPAVGISLKGNPKNHQPCPLCGGKDRFRCDDKNGSGSYICGQCGGDRGSGITLVSKFTGKDIYDSYALVAGILGIESGKEISESDEAHWRAQAQARKQTEQQAQIKAQQDTAKIAQDKFNNAIPCTTHPYLNKKGVESFGLRTDTQGNLLIPLYFHNPNTNIITLCNLQTIDTDGNKRFLKNGLVKGAFFTIGTIPLDTGTILVCEGYATGASLHQATNGHCPVIVTFNAGNMTSVAPSIRKLYPSHRLIFCGDDDRATEVKTGKNTGRHAAQEAAKTTNSEWLVPNFGDDQRTLTGELTDFNDLHLAFGIQSVQVQISHALNRPRPKSITDTSGGYTLDTISENFAQIQEIGKTTNKIYDLVNHIEMTKTHFKELVGKELANAWLFSGKQKTIARQTVRADIAKQTAQEYKSIFEQYWYIQGTKEVFNFKTSKRQPIETLRLEYPNEFDAWNKSEYRQKVESHNIWFDPTKTKVAPNDEKYINTFKDLTLQPLTAVELGIKQEQFNETFLRDMCSPIIELVSHLCGKDAHALDWVLNWLAIPLQNLGTKMDTALIVHGHIQGAGKSLFFDRIMRQIYGEYRLTLGQGQLESQYNDWVEGKLFAIFEEILQGKERYSQTGMIKQFITGDTVYINKKFVNGWTQDNFVNTVFLSNDMQPLFLEENDRRYVVLYPMREIPSDIQASVEKMLDGDDKLLIRAFYTYLLIKDVGNQTAHTKAIQTAAKTRLQELSMSSWERFYKAWKDRLLEAPYQTCLTQDLYSYYIYWCKVNGERPTSATKFLTFVGLREDKRIVRYTYDIERSGKWHTINKQAHIIYLQFNDEKPDQRWFGQAILSFRTAIGRIMPNNSS